MKISYLFSMIEAKLTSIVNRKKRSLNKMKKMGLESYIKSKIERYADSPALIDHFQKELRDLKKRDLFLSIYFCSVVHKDLLNETSRRQATG